MQAKQNRQLQGNVTLQADVVDNLGMYNQTRRNGRISNLMMQSLNNDTLLRNDNNFRQHYTTVNANRVRTGSNVDIPQYVVNNSVRSTNLNLNNMTRDQLIGLVREMRTGQNGNGNEDNLNPEDDEDELGLNEETDLALVEQVSLLLNTIGVRNIGT